MRYRLVPGQTWVSAPNAQPSGCPGFLVSRCLGVQVSRASGCPGVWVGLTTMPSAPATSRHRALFRSLSTNVKDAALSGHRGYSRDMRDPRASGLRGGTGTGSRASQVSHCKFPRGQWTELGSDGWRQGGRPGEPPFPGPAVLRLRSLRPGVSRSHSWFLEEPDWRPAWPVSRVPLLPMPVLDSPRNQHDPAPACVVTW